MPVIMESIERRRYSSDSSINESVESSPLSFSSGKRKSGKDCPGRRELDSETCNVYKYSLYTIRVSSGKIIYKKHTVFIKMIKMFGIWLPISIPPFSTPPIARESLFRITKRVHPINNNFNYF